MCRGKAANLREVAAAFFAVSAAKETNPFLAALAARGGASSVEAWPDNWAAFELFASLQTQWNIGMNGRTGLRYEALYPLLDRHPDDWDFLFADIRTMEIAALDQMSQDAPD